MSLPLIMIEKKILQTKNLETSPHLWQLQSKIKMWSQIFCKCKNNINSKTKKDLTSEKDKDYESIKIHSPALPLCPSWSRQNCKFFIFSFFHFSFFHPFPSHNFILGTLHTHTLKLYILSKNGWQYQVYNVFCWCIKKFDWIAKPLSQELQVYKVIMADGCCAQDKGGSYS